MEQVDAAAGTRNALLDAAFDEFYKTGFRAASLDDILGRTNVTKGALYHHFKNKMELGYAVVDERLGPAMLGVWLEPVVEAADPIEALVATLHGAFESVSVEDVRRGCPMANLALEMSGEDEGFRTRIGRLFERWCEAFAEVLEGGQRAGTVRADIEPASTARFIVASIEGCRVLAKNSQSRELMLDCCARLCDYVRSLKP